VENGHTTIGSNSCKAMVLARQPADLGASIRALDLLRACD
jgi:hypothetical protein